MPENEHGIEETKEALRGVFRIARFIVVRIKEDGLGVDDVLALVSAVTEEGEFKDIVMDAVEGISKVPDEVADIDITEAGELIAIGVEEVPAMIKAFTG